MSRRHGGGREGGRKDLREGENYLRQEQPDKTQLPATEHVRSTGIQDNGEGRWRGRRGPHVP